jgi:hypothetical protein
VIQYNDYEHDPRSLGHPFIAIAGRGDLECTHTQTPTHTDTYTDTKQQVISPFSCLEGAIDAKVVSIREAFGDSIHTHTDTHTQTDTPLPSPPHLSFHARVGPTHDQQAPFCWSVNEDEEGEKDRNHIHTHPHCFVYEWDRLSPGASLAEALMKEEKKRKGGGGAEEGQKRQFFLRRQNI